MAHECPDCGHGCHCGGDIDDMDFGDALWCDHCPMEVDDDADDDDDWLEEVDEEEELRHRQAQADLIIDGSSL